MTKVGSEDTTRASFLRLIITDHITNAEEQAEELEFCSFEYMAGQQYLILNI